MASSSHLPHSQFPGQFPRTRLRRNRQNEWSRTLIQESALRAKDLIWPVFIREDTIDADCQKLPGVVRYTCDELIHALEEAYNLGIRAVMLFPVVSANKRDDQASEALNSKGLLCQVVAAIKSAYPDIMVITDVALDPYTSHGQDGLVKNGKILNDETLETLKNHALVQAQAGADIIAPSEMMDGRIGVLRDHLDAHDFDTIHLMSYAAKYVSCFYGPFREALKSDTCLGTADKYTYQMDPANADEALREVALDLQEGADSIIIKPGLPYLDIVRQTKDTFKCPTIAFHVSGEYAMLKAAANAGHLDYEQALMETMICFKRAGCDAIITYGALDIANALAQSTKSKIQKAG